MDPLGSGASIAPFRREANMALLCREKKKPATGGMSPAAGKWRGIPAGDTRSDRDRVTAEDLGQVSALTGRGCGYSTLHDRVHQARHFFSQFLIV